MTTNWRLHPIASMLFIYRTAPFERVVLWSARFTETKLGHDRGNRNPSLEMIKDFPLVEVTLHFRYERQRQRRKADRTFAPR